MNIRGPRLFENLVGLHLVIFEAPDKAANQNRYDIAWPRELTNNHEADLASIERLAVKLYDVKRARNVAGQMDVASLIVGNYYLYSPKSQA